MGCHTQFTECIIFNDNRFSACNQNAKAMQIAQVHIFYADISTQPEKGSRRIPVSSISSARTALSAHSHANLQGAIFYISLNF